MDDIEDKVDLSAKERHAAWYKRVKAEGNQPRLIKLDKDIKNRFTNFRNEKGFSVNEAMDYLLSKEGQ